MPQERAPVITTHEARLAAEAWMREEAGRHPELVGAILAGSVRARDPEEPHPPSSDVDLFIYVDAEVPPDIFEPRGRFAPRKLAFRGVVLEPSFHEARGLSDPEAVLGDMHLAPIFTEPCILLDPYGRLAALAEAERAYDIAVEVRRTPVVMDWNVSRDARGLERAAVRELIAAGHHREALFQLLLVRTVAQGIIENDSGEAARASSRLGYRRLLAALGIDGDEPLHARGQALRAFLPALREGCEALLARAPWPATEAAS